MKRAALSFILLLLFTSFSGCSEEDDWYGGYNLTTVNLYTEARWFTVHAGYNVTGDPQEVGQFAGMATPGVRTGTNIGCTRAFEPWFYLRITVWNKEDTGYDPTARVLQVGNWTGVTCGHHYTFAIDSQDQVHLYRGEQRSAPFRHELTRVAPYR